MNRNLLIVDDEIEILEWLEELFKYDFDIELGVYTASSAKAALARLNETRFDVVLTDIKMPGMDGIALFERIKENWPMCKTVFLTGYRNFDDLYRIINHKDVRYILKTEGDAVIMAAVRDSLAQLEREMAQARQRMDEDRRMEKARFWMRRDLMDQVLAGMLPDDLAAGMRELGMELDAARPVLPVLLRVDNGGKGVSGDSAMQMEYLIRSLRDNQPATLQLYVHMLDRQYAALLAQSRDAAADAQQTAAVAEGMVEFAQAAFRASRGLTFSAVMYSECVSLSALPETVSVLRMQMNRYVGSAEEAVYHAAKPDMESAANAAQPGRIQALGNLMELRKEAEFYEVLHPCLAEMDKRSSLHDPRALEIYYSVAVRLLQFINENHLNEQMAEHVALYKLTDVEAHASWIEAGEYLSDVSSAIFEVLRGNESSLSDRLLDRVVTYIDAHLSEDLTLTRLAQVGGFNASYLSRLFKQMTGGGISEYITKKRMELAKQLLSGTNDRIQDIAAQTGYLSARAFTRAFRTEVGIPPKEYRSVHQAINL